MAEGIFAPLENSLSLDDSLDIVRQALDGADDGELFLERRKSESLLFDDGRLKTASYDAAEGFGLRAVRGETTGYAHSTDMSVAALRRAAETVRLAVGDGGGCLSDGPVPTNRRYYGQEDPIAETAFQDKVALLREIDAYARDLDSRVVQVSAGIGAGCQEVEILRPDGRRLRDIRPMGRLNVSVILEQNGCRETGSAAGGGRVGLEGLIAPRSWQAKIREAVRIAAVNLDAVPAPAGEFEVVLGPGWPGILLHEAVGHGLEGDFNRKESSAFTGMIGQRVAAPGVTIMDDGTLPDRRGSLNFDDEGTPSRRNTLIEDGFLMAYMQDRQNARLMGVEPTGNGRRQSHAHAPMPRMTNTCMLGGSDNPKDLVADLRDGLYAVGFGGGQVDITNGKFVFSCTEAYRVQNGRIGAPVKGATLIGDGTSVLRKIRGIGNDMELDPGIGTCGKAGQWVPVGVGQPSLRIGGLTVGGASA